MLNNLILNLCLSLQVNSKDKIRCVNFVDNLYDQKIFFFDKIQLHDLIYFIILLFVIVTLFYKLNFFR